LVGDPDAAAAVDLDRVGMVELAVAGAERAVSGEESSRFAELLDPVVGSIRHPDLAAGSDIERGWFAELAVSRAFGAEGANEGAS
jgi:hypothetical protein